MKLLALLMPLLSLATLGTFIWLVVVAFKRSALWGVLVLLLSPIAAIVFAVKHWPEHKKPFLAYGSCAAAWLMVFAATLVFVGRTVVHMAQEAQRVQGLEGTVAFAGAEPSLDEPGAAYAPEGAEVAGTDGDVPLDTWPEGEDGLQGEAGEQDAQEASAAQPAVEVRPAPRDVPDTVDLPAVQSQGPGSRGLLPVQQIDDHVGEKLRVTTKDGSEFVASFVGQSGDELQFQRRITSGTMNVYIGRNEIRTLELIRE
jgi:hypothetical protein